MSKRINFITQYDAQKLIQTEKDMYCIFDVQLRILEKLFLVGYGVTYIQPTFQSLLYLQEYGKDPGLDYQDRIKVCLIDQETHRDFCDENQLVVGTPVLQMYYNARDVRFRFLNSSGSANMTEKTSNVYIGQFHYTTISALVHMTFHTIQQMEDVSSGEIVVDVRVDQLNEPIMHNLSEDLSESDYDSETDSGEDTSEDEE